VKLSLVLMPVLFSIPHLQELAQESPLIDDACHQFINDFRETTAIRIVASPDGHEVSFYAFPLESRLLVRQTMLESIGTSLTLESDPTAVEVDYIAMWPPPRRNHGIAVFGQ